MYLGPTVISMISKANYALLWVIFPFQVLAMTFGHLLWKWYLLNYLLALRVYRFWVLANQILDFYFLSLRVVRVCMLSQFSCVQLFATLWTAACQAPLSMGFSRQEYWNGFHAPLQGIFPIEIEPTSSVSTELQAYSLLPSHWGQLTVIWHTIDATS